MKKTLIALAAVAATGAAFAQSSVTLFGIVDLNIRNVRQGGDNLTSMSQDGIASSRLGFRGVEDLGGGMSAGFWLEGALNPDTGTAGGLNFQRRSTVSLMGGFGEVRLGRDYVPTFWNHTVFDPFGTNGVGNSLNTYTVLGSGSGTNVRANNMISYFTPNLSGFGAQISYAFKETTAANDANEYAGFRVTYAAGPLSVALASASEGSTVQTQSHKRTNIAGSYDFGVAKLMAQYTQGKFGASKVNHYLIGATAPVGPGNLKASYVRSDYNAAAGDNDASQIAVGYDYNLSKRTALYGTFSRISNKNAGTFGLSPNAAAVTPGGSSTGFEFGVRHSF
ncbi:porin [Hydrogenophaga sp.]|uniref:porin n=1 Tax=Hydrogenophaga sp. TaxID=1904254 RepID=UPI0026355EFC|nr:porin [Hydrogenophaga sp.]MCW5655663.1 porin [Hydrogenophaga sp.]